MIILDKFPEIDDFYKNYWGQKPFVVRSAVDKDVFEDCIDGDYLAGLAMEADIKSRLVMQSEIGDWQCEYGPFEEDRFSKLSKNGWGLLVQNVEQYHEGTASLLNHFNFTPRWLMDDIMVSYSAVGGGVGPHTDSYHVFLIQGKGKRQWKISNTPISEDAECIEGIDLKVLKSGFDGDEVEVSMGDILYIPPHFGHEGITLEEAMTFSVGFLGPKTSEMMFEYSLHLERTENQNKRYVGQGLNAKSAGLFMAEDAQDRIRTDLTDALNSDDFLSWLTVYFSTPTHDEVDNIEEREEQATMAELQKYLQDGGILYRAPHAKICVLSSLTGGVQISIYGKTIPISKPQEPFVLWLIKNDKISSEAIEKLGNLDDIMPVITGMYNQNIYNEVTEG